MCSEKNRRRIQFLSWILILLAAGVARAQTPLSGDLVVAAFPPSSQGEFAPLPACDDAGVCGLFWIDSHPTEKAGGDILAVVLSRSGQVSRPPRIIATSGDATAGVIAVGLTRGFAAIWSRRFPDGRISPVLQYYDETLTPQKEAVRLPLTQGGTRPDSYEQLYQALRTSYGFALYAAARDQSARFSSPFVFFIGKDGKSIRPRQGLDDDPANVWEFPNNNGLAVQPNGNLIAVYTRDTRSPFDVYMRRLAVDGTLLGPEERINPPLGWDELRPAIATAPDGSFLVVWGRFLEVSTSVRYEIRARRFSAQGQPTGEPFQVNVVQGGDKGGPVITADSQGNYFIAWQSVDTTSPNYDSEVKGCLLRRDGTLVSTEIRLNQERQNNQDFPQVAFSINGTVIVGWESSSPRQKGEEEIVPVARGFAASPGQEICAISEKRVTCNLSRAKGRMDLQFVWGGQPGEVTLFGDWDGDGRDDVCSYYRGQFRCDVNHTGRATAFESFGRKGDVPLLADVDGDGQADPCVWRPGLLLCDTARDGTVGYEQAFGPQSGVPLLGDLDGDHKADLCVVTDGHWDCRTQAGQELHFDFGQAGDSFALGYADGDGRADPCLLRKGLLMCKTVHDGRAANYLLELDAAAGALLLFGNLDGL
jgi:hypothetical protein